MITDQRIRGRRSALAILVWREIERAGGLTFAELLKQGPVKALNPSRHQLRHALMALRDQERVVYRAPASSIVDFAPGGTYHLAAGAVPPSLASPEGAGS